MLKRPALPLLLLLIALTVLPAADAASPAVLRPDPLSSTVKPGDTFVVNLYLQDVADAYGADVRMCFDPQRLQVQDVDPTAPGVQIQPLYSFMQPDFVIRRDAYNAPDPARADCPAGGLVWYAFTQLNPTPAHSGSGPLAAVAFKALRSGLSPLTIAYQKAADPAGAEIPTVHQDGSVRVKTRLLLPVVVR